MAFRVSRQRCPVVGLLPRPRRPWREPSSRPPACVTKRGFALIARAGGMSKDRPLLGVSGKQVTHTRVALGDAVHDFPKQLGGINHQIFQVMPEPEVLQPFRLAWPRLGLEVRQVAEFASGPIEATGGA
eukprot:CAMPEP_0170446552 /NCGR_PEP_ID=MMETSP0117_2-20130122/49668_1 /TAXON_ID=400756 /ORGANISM="Durinskia baltica, Strain CSIRO CS-38" /LENGTH=128 /DNA_ID=CAMNT_0010707527 /DNA_START=45 /DNA_END=428 /DNA_ORIENTATION=+